MRNFNRIILGILLLTLACTEKKEFIYSDIPTVKTNGHEQGNGTDNLPFDYGAAWIYAPNKIRYCLEIAPDFGVDGLEIKNEVSRAFELWRQYIQFNKVNEHLEKKAIETLSDPAMNNDLNVVQSLKNQFHLSTDVYEMANCDGSENITFYFGVENALVLSFKKNYYDPTAFVERLSTDSQLGVSKGFVWIAKKNQINPQGLYPNWDLKNRLLGVLTHEIGHIYGIGHIENTIMRQDMFTLMLGPPGSPGGWTTIDQTTIEEMLCFIDHTKALFVPDNFTKPNQYTGAMTFEPNSTSENVYQEISENYKFLTGFDPQDVKNVNVTLHYPKIWVGGNSNYSAQLELHLDEKNATVVEKPIFLMAKTWEDMPGLNVGAMRTSLSHTSRNVTGTITTNAGEIVPIIFQQNMGLSPLRITYLKDGKEHALLIMKGMF